MITTQTLRAVACRADWLDLCAAIREARQRGERTGSLRRIRDMVWDDLTDITREVERDAEDQH